MKRIFASFILLFCLTTSHAQKIIAGTYNIRLQTTADSGNLWVSRAPAVVALIRFHEFDIFGTQEGFRNQLFDIQRSLPGFEFYGAGRMMGRKKVKAARYFTGRIDSTSSVKAISGYLKPPTSPRKAGMRNVATGYAPGCTLKIK